jgi:hypothetical protein
VEARPAISPLAGIFKETAKCKFDGPVESRDFRLFVIPANAKKNIDNNMLYMKACARMTVLGTFGEHVEKRLRRRNAGRIQL